MTEQQEERRPRALGWLIAGLVIWVAALIAGIIVLAARGDAPITTISRWDEEHVAGDGAKVALIEITGEIVPGRGSVSFVGERAFGSDDYVSMLRQAEEDDDIVAVIVRLNTPGGSVVASDDVYRMVKEVDGTKPVIATMADVAASGGYYIAAGARHIVADPSTITGSIGVIAFFPNLEGTASKLGVRPVVIKSGRLKDIGSPFRGMTPAERAVLQELIDESYGRFVDVVADARGLAAPAVRRIADGRIYSGRQAMQMRLVDSLGGLERAVDEAQEATGEDALEVVRYVPPALGLSDLVGRAVTARLRGSDLARLAGESIGLPARAGLHYVWLG